MIRYVIKSLLSRIRHGRSLYALTTLGVALGVASVLCIQIINQSSLDAFSGSMRALSGEADLSVVGRTGSFPDEIYPIVLGTPGVVAAWPMVRIDVALAGERGRFLELIGMDLFAPVQVPWESGIVDPAAALREPGWTAVTPALASARGWTLGDEVDVTSGDREVTLRIGAFVDFQAVSPLASPTMVVMDISQAQSRVGRVGYIHQIDLALDEGVEVSSFQARLQARLGPDLRVLTPEARRAEAADLMSAFRLNLTALSLISLFVGGFLVYSATQASLVRRRNEFGLLRSLGATRGQVLGLILGEAGLLGIMGVAIGMPLGYLAARLNIERVSATVTNLYLLNEIADVRLPLWLAGLAVVLGVAGAWSGAILPALEISRRDTRALLAPYTLGSQVGRVAGRLFVIGILGLALAASAYLVIGESWRGAGFGMAMVIVVTIPLLSPAMVKWVGGATPVRRFGWALSVRNLVARLATTSVAVSALAVSVSMLFGITIMVGSFRQTLTSWLGTTIRADIYVTAESWRRGGEEATLSDDLVADLANVKGVAAVDRLRQLLVHTHGRRIAVAGVDIGLSTEAAAARFDLLAGDPEVAFAAVQRGEAVLVSEPLARKVGLSVGDHLELPGPSGGVSLPITGVFHDYASDGGTAIVDIGTFARLFGPGEVQSVALYLDPDRDPERVADLLMARFEGAPLSFRSNRRLREESLEVFDQTFAITRILQLMAMLVAVTGITLTLVVLARERVSELALFRALGARRLQIFRLFLGEGLSLGVMGVVMGALGGIAFALILIFGINRAYFGWTLKLHWPLAALARDTLLILLAAVAASVYPALRASGTPAGELNREDL